MKRGKKSTHINWFSQVLPGYHPHPLKTPTPKKHCGGAEAPPENKTTKQRSEGRTTPRWNESKIPCDGHFFLGEHLSQLCSTEKKSTIHPFPHVFQEMDSPKHWMIWCLGPVWYLQLIVRLLVWGLFWFGKGCPYPSLPKWPKHHGFGDIWTP